LQKISSSAKKNIFIGPYELKKNLSFKPATSNFTFENKTVLITHFYAIAVLEVLHLRS
jgi:hypothetical protein